LTSLPIFTRLLLLNTHVGLVKIAKIVNLVAFFFLKKIQHPTSQNN